MGALMDRIVRLWMRPQDSQLADEIAHRSRAEVWARVSRTAPSLSLAEARGYVRARSAVVVDAQLDALRRQRGEFDDAELNRLRGETLEAVVELILSDLSRQATQHFDRRRAA